MICFKKQNNVMATDVLHLVTWTYINVLVISNILSAVTATTVKPTPKLNGVRMATRSHAAIPIRGTMVKDSESTCLCPRFSMKSDGPRQVKPTRIKEKVMPSISLPQQKKKQREMRLRLKNRAGLQFKPSIAQQRMAYTCSCLANRVGVRRTYAPYVKPSIQPGQVQVTQHIKHKRIMPTHSKRPDIRLTKIKPSKPIQIKASIIQASPAKSKSMVSAYLEKKIPVQAIPPIYYAFYGRPLSGKNTVQDIFKYVYLKKNQAIAVTDVNVLGGGDLMHFSGDQWKTLRDLSTSNAMVLNRNQKIKLIGKPTFSGVFMIKFTIITSQKRESLNLDGMDRKYFTLYGLMSPKKPSIKLSARSVEKTIEEDSLGTFISLSEYINQTMAQLVNDLPTELKGPRSQESLKNIKIYKDKMYYVKAIIPMILVRRASHSLGRWTYYDSLNDGKEKGDKKNPDGGGGKTNQVRGSDRNGDSNNMSDGNQGKSRQGNRTRSQDEGHDKRGDSNNNRGNQGKPDQGRGSENQGGSNDNQSDNNNMNSSNRRKTVQGQDKRSQSRGQQGKLGSDTRSQKRQRKRRNLSHGLNERVSALKKKVSNLKTKVNNLRERVQILRGKYMAINSFHPLKTTSKLHFKPHPNRHGEAIMMLTVGMKNLKTRKFTAVADLTIKINILNKNDRPLLQKRIMHAPVHLPYQMETENNGFQIARLTKSKAVYDPDNREVGIAVVQGKESSLGKFQYKCNQETWTDINVKNSIPLGRKNAVTAIFLRPTDHLRFQVTGDKFWKEKQGRIDASIKILAWDMSNNRECGEKILNVTEVAQNDYLSAVHGAAKLIQLRKGCDQRPGTIPFFDACRKCMGDNSTCMGCDKKLNSKARLDKCMVCSGGDTKIKPNKDLDCAGTCNKSYIDSCKVCQVKGFETERDCNKDCLGTAIKNKCGVCVLGRTGKSKNHGMDACGVCKGNNDTCLDCAMVPNGRNRTDLCGNCLQPNDPLYNAGCGTKLGTFHPTVIYTGKMGHDIYIKSSSFNTAPSRGRRKTTTITCKFNDISAIDVKTKSKGSRLLIKARTPASLIAGVYKISCEFMGKSKVNAVAMGELQVINLQNVMVKSISPSMSKVGTENITLTITGTGFVNTSQLSCCYGNIRNQIKAIFVSSTEIKCILSKSKTRQSRTSNVYLNFGSMSMSRITSMKLFRQHHLGLDVPSMKSAKFNKRLSAVHITFNHPGRLKKGITCANLFPYNYTQFGKKAKCRFTANVLTIYLIGSPTLRAGKLIIDRTKIQARASVTIPPKIDKQTVTIEGPREIKPPKCHLHGSKFVGKCDPIKLDAFIPGGDPSGLRYSWSAALAPGETPLDAKLTAKLVSLNEYLKRFRKRKCRVSAAKSPFIGKKILFSVTVSNFLNAKNVANFTVLRTNRTDPLVRLSRKTIKARVSQQIRIKAHARISSCLDRSSFTGELLYQWEITPAVAINTRRMSSSRLVIPRKALKGNTTYRVTVEVGMLESPEYTVTEEATIRTLSSNLVPDIDGVQTISSNGVLKLSAKNSYDPDGNKGNQNVSYNWFVLNKDRSAVFLPTKKRLLLPSTKEISLNVAKNLKPRRKYIFVLSYRIGERIAKHYHTVKVVDGSPPDITIRSKPGTKNPSSKITIFAVIKDTVGGTYKWTCEDVESTDEKLYGMVELISVNLTKLEGKFRRGRKRVALKFKKNTLSGGTFYRFNLTASNNRNATASAIFEFKTNSVPMKGLIEVSPTIGIAMNTSFNISATEGWTDPDGDALNFKYLYSIGNQKPQILKPQDDDSYWLPAGNITVIVRCVDEYRGFSQATTQVIVKKPDEVNLDALDKQVDMLDKGKNVEEVGALATMYVDTVGAGGKVELTEPQKVLQGKMVNLMCKDTDNIETSDEKSQRASGLASTTFGGTDFSPDMKKCVIGLMKHILGMLEGNKAENSRRRRRALALNKQVEEKSPEEVESDLKTYSNVIAPEEYDEDAMKFKADMLSAMNTLTAGMCKGFAVGEAAGIAKNPLVHLQTVNKDFSDVDVTQIKLGQSNDYMKSPDYVLLGSSIKNLQKCGESGDTACSSACVSSWQMKHDLFSSSSNSSIKSNILSIKLWDSETQRQIDVSDTSIEMLVDIVGTNVDRNKTYICHVWDSNTKAWVDQGVETVKTQEVVSLNGTKVDVVKCKMTKLAHLSLFEGPDKIEPTDSMMSVGTTVLEGKGVMATRTVKEYNTIKPSTSSSHVSSTTYSGTPKSSGGTSKSGGTSSGGTSSGGTSSGRTSSGGTTSGGNSGTDSNGGGTPTGGQSTLKPEDYPHHVRFTFDYPKDDCSAKLSKDPTAFKNDIRQKVATKTKIVENRLKDFLVSCGSIIVNFVVVKSNGDSFTVKSATQKIRDLVSNGDMKIMIDNKETTADKQSFISHVDPSYGKPRMKKEGMSIGVIAAIVICTFLAVLILVLMIIYVKKKSKEKNVVEPDDNSLELKGKCNNTYSCKK